MHFVSLKMHIQSMKNKQKEKLTIFINKSCANNMYNFGHYYLIFLKISRLPAQWTQTFSCYGHDEWNLNCINTDVEKKWINNFP